MTAPPPRFRPMPPLLAGIAGFFLGVRWLESLPSGGDVGSIVILLLPTPLVTAALAAGAATRLARWRPHADRAVVVVLAVALVAVSAAMERGRPTTILVEPPPAAPAKPAPRPEPRRTGTRQPEWRRSAQSSHTIIRDLAPGADPSAQAVAIEALLADPTLLDDVRGDDGALPREIRTQLRDAAQAASDRRKARIAAGKDVGPDLGDSLRRRVLLREAVRTGTLREVLQGNRSSADARALLAGLSEGWLDQKLDEDGHLTPEDAAAVTEFLRSAAVSADLDLAFEARVSQEGWLPPLIAPTAAKGGGP